MKSASRTFQRLITEEKYEEDAERSARKELKGGAQSRCESANADSEELYDVVDRFYERWIRVVKRRRLIDTNPSQ